MKANEVRLGNWVDFKESVSGKNWGNVTIDRNFFNHYDKNWVYEPIPLTEEWLVKFGFYQEKEGNFNLDVIEDVGLYSRIYDNPFMFFLDVDSGVIELNHIKHVHQLQNLYHALTGKELTIK